jgi:hypothetical protein
MSRVTVGDMKQIKKKMRWCKGIYFETNKFWFHVNATLQRFYPNTIILTLVDQRKNPKFTRPVETAFHIFSI